MTGATQAKDISRAAMYARLDQLSTAKANMHMAWAVLVREFGLSRRDAGQVVRAWMQKN